MKSIRELTENFAYKILEKFTKMVYEGGEETEFRGVKVLQEKENVVKK